MSKFPAIGEPQPTVESLLNTVQALKIAVEMLSGQRPGDGAAVTRYEQATPPSNVSVGDMWINSSDAGKTYYWNGSYWVDISNSRFEELAGQTQATLSEEQRAELTDEWWAQLTAEHRKISAEIDGAVEQSRVEFNNAVTEAEAAIALVQADVDAARDEAQADIAAVQAAIALVQTDIDAARDEAQAAIAAANSAIEDAETAIAANQVAVAAAQADVDAALAELESISTTIVSIQSDVADNSAAITVEAGARASADSAIAGQITTIQANVANNSAAITQEAVARADADTAISATVTTLTATVNANTAAVSNEAIARADGDSALSAQLTSITATVNSNTAAISSEAAARASADAAIVSQVNSLTATVNSNSASITSEAVARANADTALSSRIDNITATAGGATAAIDQEAIARAAADEALAAQITTLTTTVNSNTAAITNESVARSNADSALAADITVVSAVASKQRVFSQTTAPSTTGRIVGDLWVDTDDSNRLYYWTGTAWELREDPRIPQMTAAITTEQIARADADTALAAQINTVSAAANKQRVFNQTTAPTASGRLVGDLWFDSDDGFKPYYWNGSAWVENSDGRFATIAASVTTETAARVSADTAIAAQITSLTSTSNNNTAAISNEAVTRANADSALAGQITSVNAVATKQRVFRQTSAPASTGLITGDLWFDTDDNNKPYFWNGTGWTDTTDARITTLQADVTTEIIARANGDSALAAQISTVSASASKQRVFRQTTAPSSSGLITGDIWINTADSNKIYYWSGSTWVLSEDTRIPSLEGSVTNEAIATANADSALAAQISTVSASANKQRVFNQTTAPTSTGRLVGDLWFDSDDGFKPYYWNGSAWVDNSDNRFTTIAASVTNEAAARVAGDSAIAAQITALTSTVNGNTAAISSEAVTRANADSSLSASLSSLQSTVNNNKATLDNEIVTRASADSALSGQITSLTSTVNTNKAALDNEIIARANADSAISSSVSNLTTTVNGQTATINTINASYNGIAVKFGVNGYINGQTGGFVLTGVGRNDGTASYLLEITSDVVINGNLLVNGSTTVNKISTDTAQRVSNGGYAEAYGQANTAVYCRAGAKILVIGTYAGGDDSQGAPTIPGFGGGGGGYAGMLRVFVGRPEGYNTIITENGIKGVLRDWSSGVTCTYFGCATTFTNYYTTVSSTVIGLFTPGVEGWHNFFVQPFSSDPNQPNPSFFGRLTKIAVLELAR